MRALSSLAVSLLALFCLTLSSTASGGWSPQLTPITSALHGVSFPNQSLGCACGDLETIIHTTNGGDSWVTVLSGSYHLYSIHLVSNTHGWAVGVGGTIRNTTNGGASWGSQVSGVPNNLYGVYFINQNEGWAVGELGVILHTTDGGDNWGSQFPTSYDLHDIFFWSQSQGWVCGKTAGIGAITGYTTNGGLDWTFQYYGSYFLYDLHFSSSQRGWACGSSGSIIYTGNGGASWGGQHSGGDHLNGIWMVDLSNGWSVGDNETILKTTNGGAAWLPDTCPVSVHLRGVCFTDLNHGWAVGTGGTVIHYSGVGVEEHASHQLHVTGYQLLQNHPNPFSHSTLIELKVKSEKSKVSLKVYDLAGRLVRTLVDDSQSVTSHESPVAVRWDGRDTSGRNVSSGVYLYQLRTEGFTETRKLTLLR